MFDLDRWQEILHALKKNKLRTILTAFGVFWGIFMLIVMLGAGKGLENGAYYGMGDFATNSLFIWTQRTTIPHNGLPRGRRWNFTNDDTEAIRNQIPEIEIIAPRLQAWGGDGQNNVVRGLKTGAFNILGDYPEFNLIDPLDVSGRFINHIDITRKRKVTVIGQRVYDLLFEQGEEAIGEYIRIQGVYFQVVGVFRSKHPGGWGEWQEQAVFLPFTTLQKTYNYGNMVGYYSMTAKEGVQVSDIEKKVKDLMKRRNDIHPDDDQAFGSNNLQEEIRKMNGLFNGINSLTWFVGICTLLAGVIGVSNIMLVIVKERTKEIGIHRAVGATPFSIMSQVVVESVFLTTIAGYIGLVIGVGLVELISNAIGDGEDGNVMFIYPEVDFKIAVSALVILIVAGAFAGLIPAKRAVSIKPIDALRDE